DRAWFLRELLRAGTDLRFLRRELAGGIAGAQTVERAAETEAAAVTLGLWSHQLLAPLLDRLRTLADLQPQRLVNRRQEARTVRAQRSGPGGHILVVD